ncbi:flavin reductase family protein [Georgenia sp. AZ-5]|uniref:flavin reductase family protein n=1 Tax=Georgenia sp. AZ-5 TaxID=3367526 RepID=UPI003755016C
MLAFSVAATSSARPAIEAVAAVVVNFLAEDQRETAARFATSGIDRFAVRDWLPLPTGEPVLEGTTAWVRGRVEQRVPVGDSLLVTVRAELAEHGRRPDPLVYADRAYHQVGPHTRLP